MQWMEAKVTFSSGDDALTAELVSSLFQDLDITGVVVDDPHLEPVEGWGDDAVAPPDQPAVTGYLAVDRRLDRRCRALEQALGDLADRHPFVYSVHYQPVDEEDWAESWKAFFFPEQISATMVVKPTWRDYTPEPGRQVIEIDPGMAFGTGTHPTTALCVELLERNVRPGDAVLDVGTGSGILLIAAAKLGAGRLTGVDLDPVAVEVAEANLRLNGIADHQFNLSCGNLTETVDGVFDGVVANILADVIVDLLDHVAPLLKPDGWLICSGIIQAYRERVARKMAACGFRVEDVLERGDWVALACRLESAL
jgi:ribosomal protein L11 methyltransferase